MAKGLLGWLSDEMNYFPMFSQRLTYRERACVDLPADYVAAA